MQQYEQISEDDHNSDIEQWMKQNVSDVEQYEQISEDDHNSNIEQWMKQNVSEIERNDPQNATINEKDFTGFSMVPTDKPIDLAQKSDFTAASMVKTQSSRLRSDLDLSSRSDGDPHKPVWQPDEGFSRSREDLVQTSSQSNDFVSNSRPRNNFDPHMRHDFDPRARAEYDLIIARPSMAYNMVKPPISRSDDMTDRYVPNGTFPIDSGFVRPPGSDFVPLVHDANNMSMAYLMNRDRNVRMAPGERPTWADF